MSTTFYMTPFDPKAWANSEDTSPKPTSDLKIDPAIYGEKLKERWPELSILDWDDKEYFSLRWTLPSEVIDGERYGGLLCGLLTDQQIVGFGTGPKKSFIEFILWHRAFVHEKYPLYLSNSSEWENHSLLLTRDTTEQDIVDFTGIVA